MWSACKVRCGPQLGQRMPNWCYGIGPDLVPIFIFGLSRTNLTFILSVEDSIRNELDFVAIIVAGE